MPLYDYDCAACGRRIEVVHGVHAPGPEHCPNCGGGPLKKAFAAPAIHFKGSGWAKKERRAALKSSSASEGGGAAGDDAKEPAKAVNGSDGDGGEKGGEKSREKNGEESREKSREKNGDGGTKKSAPANAAPASD